MDMVRDLGLTEKSLSNGGNPFDYVSSLNIFLNVFPLTATCFLLQRRIWNPCQSPELSFLFLAPPPTDVVQQFCLHFFLLSPFCFLFLFFYLRAYLTHNDLWQRRGGVNWCGWGPAQWGSLGGCRHPHPRTTSLTHTNALFQRDPQCDHFSLLCVRVSVGSVGFCGCLYFMLLIWQFQLRWQLAFPQTASIAFNGGKLIVVFLAPPQIIN